MKARSLQAIIIGMLVGAFDGVGIFWAPGEPYKTEIFIAAILKGILVSLMVHQTLKPGSRWVQGLLSGVVYGFLFATVVFLAKGGLKSMSAPFVVPAGVVMGAITGLLVWKFCVSKIKG